MRLALGLAAAHLIRCTPPISSQQALKALADRCLSESCTADDTIFLMMAMQLCDRVNAANEDKGEA